MRAAGYRHNGACGIIGRRRWMAALLVAATVLPALPIRAVESRNELKIKAAYLYQFAKFSEWPPAAFEKADSDLVLGVLGSNPFGKLLDGLNGKTIKGRKVVVVHCENTSDARKCHVLFIPGSMGEEAIAKALKALDGVPVLTVGDANGFSEQGGMIQMYPESGKVRFNINLVSAKAAGIKLDSRFLGLARKVKRE